jgi:hypothetical protein
LDPALFIRRNTAIAAPPLVPEIQLHLATEVTPIWQASEESLARGAVPPPFWAFAWAGGQALARYLIDRPETVAGRLCSISAPARDWSLSPLPKLELAPCSPLRSMISPAPQSPPMPR